MPKSIPALWERGGPTHHRSKWRKSSKLCLLYSLPLYANMNVFPLRFRFALNSLPD